MNTTSTHTSPAASSTTETVYECSECGEQTLQQRCEDCNLFTRRLGAGGHCPHCDELLLITDLDLPPARSTTKSYTDNLTSSQPRLEGALTVPWDRQTQLPDLALHRLGGVAVTVGAGVGGSRRGRRAGLLTAWLYNVAAARAQAAAA